MSKEQIIESVREWTERLGHVPSRNELTKVAGVSPKQVRWHFGTYTRLLRESELERRGGGVKLDMEALLRDWAGMVRDLRKLPSLTEYEQFSKFSTSPLKYRFGVWAQVPFGMKQYIEESGRVAEMQDVLEVIEAQRADVRPGITLRPRRARVDDAEGAPLAGLKQGPDHAGGEGLDHAAAPGPDDAAGEVESRPKRVEAPEKTKLKRGAYGELMRFGPMVCAPTNEQGVLFLLGAMAEKLGFALLKVGTAFPDCQAFRVVDGGRLELVDIEIEFESRNFLKHLHDAKKCGLIVCWEHNWQECPLPVIELKEAIGSSGHRDIGTSGHRFIGPSGK